MQKAQAQPPLQCLALAQTRCWREGWEGMIVIFPNHGYYFFKQVSSASQVSDGDRRWLMGANNSCTYSVVTDILPCFFQEFTHVKANGMFAIFIDKILLQKVIRLPLNRPELNAVELT